MAVEVERHLLKKLEEVKLQPECEHRHVKRLHENSSDFRVHCLITPCPSAQQSRLLARHRRAESCIVLIPLVGNVAAATNNHSLDFPFREGFLHLFGVQSRDSRQGPDPLGKPRPHLGALHAGDRGVHVLPGQRRVTQMVIEEHLVTHEQAVPFASIGFCCVHVRADLQREGHVELADKPTEHPGAG